MAQAEWTPSVSGQKGLRRSAERAAQVFEANAAVMAAADRDNTSAGPASAAYKPAPVERAAQVFAANAAAMAAADCVSMRPLLLPQMHMSLHLVQPRNQ